MPNGPNGKAPAIDKAAAAAAAAAEGGYNNPLEDKEFPKD